MMTSPLYAADSFFETQEIFLPSSDHYYHIPGIVVTAKGTVLVYGAWRQASAHDWGNIHIDMRRSIDGGKTWDDERQIAHLGDSVKAIVRSSPPKQSGHEDEVTVDNPTMIVDRNGTVHMLYQIEYRRVFYMRSNDDGITWSKPVEISQVFEKFRPKWDWKIVAPGPGHGIQLKNGRLVVPVWMALGGNDGYEHRPSETAVVYSDDHGATWLAGDVVAQATGRGANPDVFHDPNETVAVQLADGSVLFNIRAPSARQRRLESVSPDGATGWSKPKFIDDLPEPVCFGSIERLSEVPPSNKNRILFSIPAGLNGGKSVDELWCKREDMTVFLSYDEGKTWPVKKIIERGSAGAGYSDLAVLPDGTILCAYGTGAGFGPGAGIAVARFNLEWLTDGADSVPASTAGALAAQTAVDNTRSPATKKRSPVTSNPSAAAGEAIELPKMERTEK